MASWIGTGGSNPGDVCTNGKIGIGTSPGQPLHIYSTSNYPMAVIESTQNGGGDVFLKSSAGSWEMYMEGSDLRFYNGSADKVTIKNDGKVGIGTTNPSYELDVQGSGVGGELICATVSSGSKGAIVGVSDTGNAVTGGCNGAGFGVYGASYHSSGIGGYFGNNENGIALQTGNGTVYLSGNVGIGTASPNQKLEVNGSIRTTALGGGGDRDIGVDNDGDIIIYSSDRRLKKNIKSLGDAVEKITKMRGVTFEWKNDKKMGKGKRIGLIAQEVEKIAPEVVSHPKDGMLSIRYRDLTGLFVEAIKEQQDQIKTLEKKIKKLEGKKAK